MPQHDQVIDNGPGLAVRTDINAAFAAIFSSSSGTVEPAVRVAGQLWFNTTTGRLQVRNSANTAWQSLTGELAGTVSITSPVTFSGPTPDAATPLIEVRNSQTTTGAVGNAVFAINRQNSVTEALIFGNDANGAALIGGNNNAMRFGNWVSGVFTERMNVTGAGVWTFAGTQQVIIGGTPGIEVVGSSPNIKLTDNTASAHDFWMHADGNQWYVLVDRTATGTWDTPHPLQLNAATNTGSLFGSPIITAATLPSGVTTATANTLVQRDSSADIHARLFRSEYAVNNASIGFIMTQVDTGANNYVRPSTPTQLATRLNSLPLTERVQTPVYIGTDANNVEFPVGTTVLIDDATLDRNAAATVRIATGSAALYTLSGAGAALAGTWRARGTFTTSQNSVLMQRVT